MTSSKIDIEKDDIETMRKKLEQNSARIERNAARVEQAIIAHRGFREFRVELETAPDTDPQSK
ncbi:MAG: hypothetical protein HY308_18355 [Gammaproteobacteria bacterium]|nr:hypothetical protein [Gammaproteobacteria bacterium]